MILAVCKGNEDDTLTVFTCLIEDTSFGDYFERDKNFEALHADTKKLDDLLIEHDETLAKHLKQMQFDLVSITPTWLLTCFFLQIGPEKAVMVLDQVLKSGNSARHVLVNHAVSLLLEARTELLECSDVEDIFFILKGKKKEEERMIIPE